MINSKSKFKSRKIKRKGIWQLLCATDFESLMYPCITFCRILGIFPYRINASIINTCKPSYILSIIIFCVFCTFDLMSLYELNISKHTFKDFGTSRVLERNCFYIFGGFIPVTTFILSGPRMRFLQTIIELSLKLPSKSYQNASKLIHTKDIFGTLCLIVQMVIYYSTLHLDVIRKCTITYIFLTEFQINMLYMNCVCILKACFKQINDTLANLRELKNDEPYLMNGNYQEQRIPCLLMEITALKKQHLAINDTVRTLNTIFSLQIFATIIMTFIEITFNLYFYLMRQIQGDTYMNRDTYFRILIVITIYHFIKIVLIIWACETGKNEAMEIGNTVHNVFNSTNNKQIKYELQLFSLQILHHKNDIFSIKVISMDAAFLTEIVGGITTYLLILIQFLLGSCDGKSIRLTDIV